MNKAVGFDRVRVRHVGGEKHEVVWACVNCILTANESQFPAEDVKYLVLALVHVRGWLFSPFRRELNECDIAIHLVPDRFDCEEIAKGTPTITLALGLPKNVPSHSPPLGVSFCPQLPMQFWSGSCNDPLELAN